MQVPRFSPRISLIEMAPRPAPRSGCPGHPAPALPCPVCHHRQTDTTMFALICKIEHYTFIFTELKTFTQNHVNVSDKYLH